MGFIILGMVAGINVSHLVSPIDFRWVLTEITRQNSWCLAHLVGTAHSVGIWASPTAVRSRMSPYEKGMVPKVVEKREILYPP